MTLQETQGVFCQRSASFISWLFAQGYVVTYGEAYRPPEMAAIDAAEKKGIVHSLHTQRLAIDLNLFKDGVLLPYTVDAYRLAGECWKAMSTPGLVHEWGGSWTPADVDHFSIGYMGIK